MTYFKADIKELENLKFTIYNQLDASFKISDLLSLSVDLYNKGKDYETVFLEYKGKQIELPIESMSDLKDFMNALNIKGENND